MGEPEEAMRAARRGRVIGENLDDFALQIVADAYLGWAHHSLGDCRKATDLFRQSVLRLGPDLFGERFGQAAIPAVFARARLAWCLAELGEFGEGCLYGEEAMQIAEAADQPFSVVVASISLGSLSLLKGDLAKAIAALEHAVSLCRVWNIPTWLPTAASSLGYAYVLSGRLTEAFPLLEEAINLAASMKIGYHDAFQLGWLSEGLLADHRSEAAIPLVEQALRLAREGRRRGQEACAQLLLGDIASHRDPPDAGTAEDYYRKAMALAEQLGMRPLVAHCHAGLAKLYRRTGKRNESDEHFRTATSMYREMGMTYWLGRDSLI